MMNNTKMPIEDKMSLVDTMSEAERAVAAFRPMYGQEIRQNSARSLAEGGEMEKILQFAGKCSRLSNRQTE